MSSVLFCSWCIKLILKAQACLHTELSLRILWIWGLKAGFPGHTEEAQFLCPAAQTSFWDPISVTLAAVPATKLWLARQPQICTMLPCAAWSHQLCLQVGPVWLKSHCTASAASPFCSWPLHLQPAPLSWHDLTRHGSVKERIMKEWTTQEYDYLFRMLLIGDSGSASFATALTLHRLILSLCDVHSHPNLR